MRSLIDHTTVDGSFEIQRDKNQLILSVVYLPLFTMGFRNIPGGDRQISQPSTVVTIVVPHHHFSVDLSGQDAFSLDSSCKTFCSSSAEIARPQQQEPSAAWKERVFEVRRTHFHRMFLDHKKISNLWYSSFMCGTLTLEFPTNRAIIMHAGKCCFI